MGHERASAHKPAGTARRTALAARPSSGAATAGSMSAARTLQRRLGNRGTHAFAAQVAARSGAAAAAAATPIQASLAISQPGDPYEQEADRVADAVMRMPAASAGVPGISAGFARTPSIRRACAACQAGSEHQRDCASGPEAGEPVPVHRQEAPGAAPGVTPGITPAVEANVQILQGQGSPLPRATREFFEPRLGADFSQVRVNTGPRADATARSLGARAFAVGPSISFAAGEFAPASREGQHLLAHELTHVVQQDGAPRRPSAPVQRKASGQPEPATRKARPAIGRSTGGPRLQPAWYNFNIPFTDYQFDPSISGIKTAAGVVRDVAVEGLQWIADQIESLVNGALDWLRDQWAALKNLVHSAWNAAKAAFNDLVGFFKNPLGFLANAIMSLDADALARGWAAFSGLVTSLANGFKATADKIFGAASTVWSAINRYATWALDKVASLTSNFLFRKLPAFVQKGLSVLIDTLRALWKEINDGWTALVKEVKDWVDSAIDAVFGFVRKVLNFGINVVISGIVLFAQVVLFLKDLFTNPRKYVDLLAKRTVQAFDGVESHFAGMVGRYFGATKAAATPAAATVKGPATTTVARAPAPAAGKKGSASWAEIGAGVLEMMGKKWAAFKANPMAVVVDLLIDLIFPMAGNINDIIQLFKDIGRIVSGPLSAGSLEELWTSLLQILDIPILIYHTVVGILMRTLMVPLIVASFIPHPVVKGIAAAVGYALLGAFVQVELLNITHKLVLLKTGATTGGQKTEAYNRIADSLIALAMALAIALLMLLLHFLANIAKGIYNFVKGKVFGIEPGPVEGKAPAGGKGGPEEAKEPKPKTEEPAKDLGTQNGKKVLAEKATADGKHEVKVTDEGIRCCSDVCEIMIKDIDAHVADNPALKEKLDPFRKRLETAQGKLESARILQDRAPPERAAQAAQDVDAAAKAAAEVGAELKPEIDKVIRDTPLPSGLRFDEYRTPENAMGMKEGKATPAGSDPITNPESIREGYTRREYYRDGTGKKWSLDVRTVDGKPAYRLAHESSGQ
jgi:hypothetical protein